MSPTGQFTFGLSDRGDQFFLRASTHASGVQTFKYGTAVRNFDGSITYTDAGDADSGAFDQTNKTVTLKVAVGKLVPPAGHPPVAGGSVLVGLRGQAFTTAQGNNAKLDSTRGGLQYQIPAPTPTPTVTGKRTNTPTQTRTVTPTRTATATRTNTPPPTATRTPTPTPTPANTPACPTCALGYPFNDTSNPRTSVAFNESEVLRAFDPAQGCITDTGATIKLWYNDEHA
jgi:hypothetical protein